MTEASTGDSPHVLPGSHSSVELMIGGMTCASCAARIEKKLNRMPGVQASVNYATEKAHVRLPAGTDAAAAIAVVRATGYTADLPPAPVRKTPRQETSTGVMEQDSDSRSLQDLDSDGASVKTATLRTRLSIATALTVPVVALAMVPALQFTNWQWLSLTLAAPVAVWGAWPFHRAAWVNARHGAASMDTLISVGVLAAFTWSLYALFFGQAGMPGMRMHFSVLPGRGGQEIYLEVAAAVTVFILTGRYMEARAKRRSGAALRALLQLGVKDVTVVREGMEHRIRIEDLAVDDIFVTRPGEKVATDGVVIDGSGAVDASLLTGESVPVEVGVGDAVTGSTINAGGRLLVRASRVGKDTQLAQVARLVEDAQSGKAAVQRLADRVSGVFVPIVLVLAIVTLTGWLLAGHSAEAAFTAAVAVLIIACPCALGLATPTALLVGTGRGAQLGLLIKGPEVLESTRRIDTVVLDKTGTVTTGRMSLLEIHPAAGVDEGQLLRLAGAVEHASEHPIATAIAAAATDWLRTWDGEEQLPPVTSFAASSGWGVSGVVEGHAVAAGRASWLTEQWAQGLDRDLLAALSAAEQAGRTAIAVGWDGRARGVLVVADTLKPTSAAAVAQLRRLGLRAVLLTGDNSRAAHAVAAAVGIDEVIAEVLPEGKVDAVRALQDQGRVVAMVGDGVNDAAALAAADLGIAMGTGTDVAIEASDLTVMRGDLMAAVDALRLARSTLSTIKVNLFWAFAYNVAALPLAIAGLLNPLLAGAAMAASSIFVVSNSLRLRRFKASPVAAPADHLRPSPQPSLR
ncbi:heavy metal translocating P-type ATPase [Kineococcus rubinsiae]|uniref:heavy metal translocating P-type ATPase n=1 Tax=Kineococcus rubinsiae TaxID=2609562 RepID=UPI001AD8B4EB|nr:heavy metal translocating P-type ATPase [Kineococcus rubinsiae]